jgi:hypothetical protein
MATSLDRVFAQFANLYADSKPIRWQQELDAAIRAAGLGYTDVTREWARNFRAFTAPPSRTNALFARAEPPGPLGRGAPWHAN